MIVLNTAYDHMMHKIFNNPHQNHLKPVETAPNGAFGDWKSTFVNMTWIFDILEWLLWNMEMIISFNRGEYFILIVPFQFKCAIRFIGCPKFYFETRHHTVEPHTISTRISTRLCSVFFRGRPNASRDPWFIVKSGQFIWWTFQLWNIFLIL